jgi:hypothetical protein
MEWLVVMSGFGLTWWLFGFGLLSGAYRRFHKAAMIKKIVWASFLDIVLLFDLAHVTNFNGRCFSNDKLFLCIHFSSLISVHISSTVYGTNKLEFT